VGERLTSPDIDYRLISLLKETNFVKIPLPDLALVFCALQSIECDVWCINSFEINSEYDRFPNK